MRLYILYYKKYNIFANKQEKIDFTKIFFKDATKCIQIAYYKYIKQFFKRYIS